MAERQTYTVLRPFPTGGGHWSSIGQQLSLLGVEASALLGAGAEGQRRLLSVVLGAASENSRAAESQKLLNWGFTAYEAVRLSSVGGAVVTPRVWKGRADQANDLAFGGAGLWR